MEVILEGLSVILEILENFIKKKAFNKKIKLLKRIPFILLYVLILLSLILGITWLGITLIKDYNLFGYLFLFISFILIICLLYPFMKKQL